MAVGAPIVAFVRFIKSVTMCINEGVGNSFAGANAHLSEEVFAYIAVFGHNFCSSATDNSVLQNKYQNQFKFTIKIAKIFIFLGKIAVCFLNVWLMEMITTAIGCCQNDAAP